MMSRRAKGEYSAYRDTRRGGWIAAGDHPQSTASKRRRVTAKGRTKTEALERLRERLSALSRDVTTYGDLHNLWTGVGMPGRRGKSETTKQTVTHLSNSHILPTFGNRLLDEIKPEEIETFLSGLDLSLSTVKKIRGVMSQVFTFGESRRHASWNPARLATLPTTDKPEREGRALTETEISSLLNVANSERLGAWVHVTASMGLRPGETNGLRWNRVGLDEGVAVIDSALYWPNNRPQLKATKTGNTRTIAIPERTIDALRAYEKQLKVERMAYGRDWPTRWSDLVFLSERGTPLQPSNLRRLIARLGTEAGIEGTLRPYDLRHSMASLLAAQGVPPLILAELLGHRDTRMLERHYVHSVTPRISAAADHWPASSQ